MVDHHATSRAPVGRSRATANAIGAATKLKSAPILVFGQGHTIGAPAGWDYVLRSGPTGDADHELRRSPVVGSVGRDCRERVFGSRALGRAHTLLI